MNKKYIIGKWTKHIIPLSTGINMAYYECGPASGKPLLLIHGITDARISWTQLAPILADMGNRCYIVEYRGNGATDIPDCGNEGYTAWMIADDIMDLMLKINLTHAHIVGHSYGSLIAQVLVGRLPEACDSITLIDTAIDCRENATVLELLNGDGKDFLGVYGYCDYLPESFVRRWAYTSNEDMSFREATLDNVRKMPVLAWQNLISGLANFNNDRVNDIRGKIQIIWGTNDDIFPFNDQITVRRSFQNSGAKFIDVDGASHNGFWDSMASAKHYAHLINDFVHDD